MNATSTQVLDGSDTTMEITNVAPRNAAAIRIESRPEVIGEAIEAAMCDLEAAIAAGALRPIGAPFVRYLSWSDTAVVAEAGMPISGTIASTRRIVPVTLPGGEVGVATHVGPYDTIGETYGRLGAWIREQGAEPGDTMWEVYLTEPDPESDPATWRTQVVWPIQSQQ